MQCRYALMHKTAEIYADAAEDAGAPLHFCVRFIYATDLYVERPREWSSTLQTTGINILMPFRGKP